MRRCVTVRLSYGASCYILEVRYDLFFAARGRVPSLTALREYFAGRSGYSCSGDRARYHNPATGVSFEFDLRVQSDEYVMAFELEYFRSHVFGLEALPEVAALVRHFDFGVYDPQSAEITDGSFSADRMLRGYNESNAAAYRVRLREETHGTTRLRALEGEVHRSLWRWNRERSLYWDYLGAQQGIACSVPQIELVAHPEAPDTVLTAVRWVQVLPIALPEVDVILYQRSPEMPPLAVAYADIEPRIRGNAVRDGSFVFQVDEGDHCVGLTHHLIVHAIAPPDLVRALCSGRDARGLLHLSASEILDREVVDAARSDATSEPTLQQRAG